MVAVAVCPDGGTAAAATDREPLAPVAPAAVAVAVADPMCQQASTVSPWQPRAFFEDVRARSLTRVPVPLPPAAAASCWKVLARLAALATSARWGGARAVLHARLAALPPVQELVCYCLGTLSSKDAAERAELTDRYEQLAFFLLLANEVSERHAVRDGT